MHEKKNPENAVQTSGKIGKVDEKSGKITNRKNFLNHHSRMGLISPKDESQY